MDVEPRRAGVSLLTGDPGLDVVPTRQPRRWALPAAVAAAVVTGIVSVPVIMSLGSVGSQQADRIQTTPSAASPAGAAAVGQQGATSSGAPTRAPRRSISLASPPPRAPSRSVSRAPSETSSTAGSTSASPTGPGGRTAELAPTSGPAGRRVTISGRCLAGQDARFVAGTTGSAKQALPADGSFGVQLQVATSARDSRVGATVPLIAECLNSAGAIAYRFSFTYRVTSVVSVPAQIPGGAGSLGAPDTAAVGDAVTVSGDGFMAGVPVAFQLRNADTGAVDASRQVLADDSGSFQLSGIALPGPGRVELVAAGVEPGGGQRVLASVVTTS